MGVKLGADHPVFAWIPEYAALLLNRSEISKDGRTAYERSKSKKAKTWAYPFAKERRGNRKASRGSIGKP